MVGLDAFGFPANRFAVVLFVFGLDFRDAFLFFTFCCAWLAELRGTRAMPGRGDRYPALVIPLLRTTRWEQVPKVKTGQDQPLDFIKRKKK